MKCIDAELVKGDLSEYAKGGMLYKFLEPGMSVIGPPWKFTKLDFLKVFKKFVINDNEEVLPGGMRLMTFMTYFIFISMGYSQSTLLTVVGKNVSVSTERPVTASLVDTVIFYAGEKADTVVTVKFIDPINRATYKVMELISGDLKKDTVNIILHNKDHAVSSKNVLLFLRKGDLGYILKRQPIEVYPTKDNRWASPYITEIEQYLQLKSQKTGFKSELVFDVSMYDDEYIKKHYPSPYYRIKKDKAIAVQGIYAEELSNLNWY